MGSEDLRALLDDWCSGDHDAGARLVEVLYESIRRGIGAQLALGAAEIDEVTQQVFEVFVRRRDKIERSPLAYIRSVARYKILEHKSRRRETKVLNDELHPEHGGSLSSALLRRRQLGCLVSALQNLPRSDQHCLALVYFVGRARRESARRLGLSESQLEVRIARSRRRLRAMMQRPEVRDGRVEASTGVLMRWARAVIDGE